MTSVKSSIFEGFISTRAEHQVKKNNLKVSRSSDSSAGIFYVIRILNPSLVLFKFHKVTRKSSDETKFSRSELRETELM